MIGENAKRISTQVIASTNPLAYYASQFLPRGLMSAPGAMFRSLRNRMHNDYNDDYAYAKPGGFVSSYDDSRRDFDTSASQMMLDQLQQNAMYGAGGSSNQIDPGNMDAYSGNIGSSGSADEISDKLAGIQFELKKLNQFTRTGLNINKDGLEKVIRTLQTNVTSNRYLFDSIDRNNRRTLKSISRGSASFGGHHKSALELSNNSLMEEIATNTRGLLLFQKASHNLGRNSNVDNQFSKIKMFYRSRGLLDRAKNYVKQGLGIAGSTIKAMGSVSGNMLDTMSGRYVSEYLTNKKYQLKAYREKQLNSANDSYQEALKSGDVLKIKNAKRRMHNISSRMGLDNKIVDLMAGSNIKYSDAVRFNERASNKLKPATFDEEVRSAIVKGIPSLLGKIAEALGHKDTHWSYEMDRVVDADTAVKADTARSKQELLSAQDSKRSKRWLSRLLPQLDHAGRARILEEQKANVERVVADSKNYRGLGNLFDSSIRNIDSIYNTNGLKSYKDIHSQLKRESSDMLMPFKFIKNSLRNTFNKTVDVLENPFRNMIKVTSDVGSDINNYMKHHPNASIRGAQSAISGLSSVFKMPFKMTHKSIDKIGSSFNKFIGNQPLFPDSNPDSVVERKDKSIVNISNIQSDVHEILELLKRKFSPKKLGFFSKDNDSLFDKRNPSGYFSSMMQRKKDNEFNKKQLKELERIALYSKKNYAENKDHHRWEKRSRFYDKILGGLKIIGNLASSLIGTLGSLGKSIITGLGSMLGPALGTIATVGGTVGAIRSLLSSNNSQVVPNSPKSPTKAQAEIKTPATTKAAATPKGSTKATDMLKTVGKIGMKFGRFLPGIGLGIMAADTAWTVGSWLYNKYFGSDKEASATPTEAGRIVDAASADALEKQYEAQYYSQTAAGSETQELIKLQEKSNSQQETGYKELLKVLNSINKNTKDIAEKSDKEAIAPVINNINNNIDNSSRNSSNNIRNENLRSQLLKQLQSNSEFQTQIKQPSQMTLEAAKS